MLRSTDAVIDLTMISTAAFRDVNNFSISCINGERSPAQAVLDIKKDNKILMFSNTPQYIVHKPRNKKVVARNFNSLEHIGIFYCESSQDVPLLEKVTMINNCNNGVFMLHATKLLFIFCLNLLHIKYMFKFNQFPFSRFPSKYPHIYC